MSRLYLRRIAVVSCLVSATASTAVGQVGRDSAAVAIRDAVRSYRQAHERAIVEELRQLVALPNVARNAEDIASNAALLRQMLERRGFTTQTLSVAGAPPAVYGSLAVHGATRTVVFYAHYDGQPVTPGDWKTPAWTPVLRAGTIEAGAADVAWDALPDTIPGQYRLYGRATSDDKAPSSPSSRVSMRCGPRACRPR
jgi:acetylornithine deacetylase/succinyl-diaminopimelate desuccinylase-like protein